MRTIFAGLMLLASQFVFAQIIAIESLPALQQPVSNNAVPQVQHGCLAVIPWQQTVVKNPFPVFTGYDREKPVCNG